MKSRLLRPRTLAAAVAALVAAAGLSADDSFARSPISDSGKPDPSAVVGPLSKKSVPARYIVRFVEQPLAQYNSVAASKPVGGIGMIPNKLAKNGRSRLDVKSSQAVAYVQYVKEQQQQHLSAINSALGQTITPRYSMQHALNAVVVSLTPEQADKVAKLPGVMAVNLDVPHPLATDIGPGFIGAASVWWGSPAGQDTIFANQFDGGVGFRGDNIVVGDIDTGYNSESPSFQATGSDGVAIKNPLGTGQFLGQCGVNGISLGGCNDKVIGVYDEIDLTGSCTGACPTQFSVEDVQGHGSHTASTAAGDYRSANLGGYVAPIAGVAPHANLVVFYACSPDTAIQCSTAATSAAVDQAIQDGVVDALNYSISGGNDPWNEPTSQAFLSAVDAGIFVAAAAGNTGASVPLAIPGTANHAEPWTITVAAGTHTGGPIAPDFSITAAGAPASVQNIPLNETAGDTHLAATITAPVIESPSFQASNTSGSDGCTAYPAGQFTGAVALISRGTCSFFVKVEAAVAAGAIAVLITDNRPEGPQSFIVNDGGVATGAAQPIPVYAVTQVQGLALASYLDANSKTAASVIPYPPIRQPSQPDVLADFSLLGPVDIDVMKPDIQGPGVQILAAFNNLNADATLNGPDNVGLDSGTSMATPHTTGSGALLFGLHPDWTPSEVKSALMLTAKEQGLTKPNGTTPSNPYDRGSGRLNDFVAEHTGLVLNETGLNYSLADPSQGGDPSTLNIASVDANNCLNGPNPTCTFIRKVRSTQDHTVVYAATVSGDAALDIGVVPASISVAAHATRVVEFDVDATGTNSDGAPHFAEVTLTPDDTTLPTLHIPVAIRVQPPTIKATPSPLAIAITTGTTGSGTLTVANGGGPTLHVTNTNDTTGVVPFVLIDQPSQGNNGDFASFFLDFGAGGYSADDFVVPVGPANISRIVIPGFTTGGVALSAMTGQGVHFRIYGNASGLPNGDPEGETSATAAVYSFNTTIGAAGLSVVGNTISLNLTAAGAPATNLAAGTYWMVVYVDTTFATQGGFAQFVTTANQGATGAAFCPACGDTAWASITDFPGFAMHIEQQVACGAPWLSATPATLSIGAAATAPLTVNANSSLFPGGSQTASAYLCLDSNDPATPILPVLINASAITVVTVNQGFDDITTLVPAGWVFQNNSDDNANAPISWFQGTPTTAAPPGPFDAQAGAAPNSYIGVNFNSTTDGTISNWMLTPPITFNAATSLSFYTRSAGVADDFPDRLEVRVCTGTCTNVGTTSTDVGDFTTLLKSINPTLTSNDDPTGANGYPGAAWGQFTVNNASGIPTTGTGRIAFRYFVTDGGPDGANSDYIGIDSVSITAQAVGRPAGSANNGLTTSPNPAKSGARGH